MRARHLPLVLLSAAALAACGRLPAPRSSPTAPAGTAVAQVRIRPAPTPAPSPAATPVAGRPTPPPGPPAPASLTPPAVAAAYRAACAAAGGTLAATTGALWVPGTCVVTYAQEGTLPVTIDPNGAFDAVWSQRNLTDCSLLQYDANLDAAAHHPWRLPPQYHPATGACFSGRP